MEFKSTIKEASRELTRKEMLSFKDTQDANSIDNLTQGMDDFFSIAVKDYVLLDVHNEKASGEPDYQTLILIDDSGKKYTTGSKSFIRQFLEIWEAMENIEPGEAHEEWLLKCFRKPSRNYTGKDFLTCTVI